MQSQKSKANKFVNSVTNFTQMRFAPNKVLTDKQQAKSTQLVQIFKNAITWGSNITNDNLSSSGPSNMIFSRMNQEKTTNQNTQQIKHEQLKYCTKLTPEHILIGNRNQLDAISIGNSSRTYLDAGYLWSLSIEFPIDLLVVDTKKSIIILGNKIEKKLWVYRFRTKSIQKKPNQISSLKLSKNPQQVYFVKDQLSIIYKDQIEIYSINSELEFHLQYKSNFNLRSDKYLKYFRTPEPLDNSINIFFTEDIENRNIFVLWLLEIEMTGLNLNMKGLQKIYEIKKSLRKKLVIKNFSKQTFLMNLGAQILAFKKGYIIDSVSISVASQHSSLKYIGEQRLIHVCDKRIQLYEFTLDTTTKPYRIKISPLDSISIRSPVQANFFRVIQVFDKNILLTFQINPASNRKTNGEINYWLALTHPITLMQKIDMLFPSRKFLSMSDQDLQDRCDMARKMGLSNKQIFLELWNRSLKRQNDFGLLISTRDYKTISDQISKLMKKNSLSFSELYKLERSSLMMLQSDVFSTSCTQQIFLGYISSSMLKKKLEFYRDICIMQRCAKQNDILMVSIKKLNQIKHIHVENTLISLMKDLCIENKPVENQIRLFFNMFKFPLRMVYTELLTKIINTLQDNFIILLEKLPEILPYDLNQQQKKNSYSKMPGFYEGIYGQQKQCYSQDDLCLDKVVTVDNKQIIQQAIKQLWFKRGFLSNHCFITQSTQKINENLKKISSQYIFYYVIEAILDSGMKNRQRKKLFNILQRNYKSRLSHLQGKINLRYLIFTYLSMKSILPKDNNGHYLTLQCFLSLNDEKLFSYMFEIQKQRKGLLLSEIKPIYEENSEDGLWLFNESLLNYFKKPVSQLSDIKYLLNRINNEKKQFHAGHQDMYKILVQAMTYKLMIGTDNDIPLSQIIIYIETVPIQKNNQILSKLTIIHDLNENIDLLSSARINMSVKQIIENPQLLMTKIINYLIQKQKLFDENAKVFDISYNILANLSFLHNAIYRQDQQPPFYIFFIFLTKLCENIHMINYSKSLIYDQFLSKQFGYDQSISQSLVIYLYKLKMSEKPNYNQNYQYLKKILTLLPDNNQIRQFIICEYQYAKLLSSQDYELQYPLGLRHSTPGLSQLESILYNLKPEKVLTVDIQNLYEIMNRLQELNNQICQTIDNLEDEEKSMIYSSLVRGSNGPSITKKQVYQVIILYLLSVKKLRQSIPYIDKFLSQNPLESDIVFPYIFLIEIGKQMSFEARQHFFKLTAYYFKDSKKLFDIIKQFLISPISSKQKCTYLKQQVQKCQSRKGLNIQNKLLNKNLIQIAIRDGLQDKLFANYQKSYKHIIDSRAEFNDIAYSFIYIILLNSPYVLAKFLLCSKKYLKIRNYRLILTYMTQQVTFDAINLIEFGKRLFLIVMFMLKEQTTLQNVIDKYFNYPLDEQLPDTITCPKMSGFQYFNRLHHSAEAFKRQRMKKLKRLQIQQKNQENQMNQMRERLLNPQLIGKEQLIQYSEISSDNQASSLMQNIELPSKKKQFDKQNQMKKAIQAEKRKKSWEVANQDLNVFGDHDEGDSKKDQDLQPQYQEKYNYYDNPQDMLEREKQYIIRVNPKESLCDQSQHQLLSVHSQKSHHSELSNNSNQHKSTEKKQSLTSQQKIQGQKLQVDSNKKNLIVKQIIKQSSLSVAGEDEELKDLVFDEKDSPYKQQHISNPQTIFDRRSELSNQFKAADFRSISIQKNQSNDKNNSGEKPSSGSPKGSKKNSFAQKKTRLQQCYPWYEGLPAVQETGRQIYVSNLIELQKKKKPTFKIKILTKYQKHPDFQKYLLNVIKYVYKQSTASPLNGIIHLIQFLTQQFKLPINNKNLPIWIRAQNLHEKYQLNFSIRNLIPITAVFGKNETPQTIFKNVCGNMVGFLNDINVFKMAKLISLAFLVNSFQDQIIFGYLIKLLNMPQILEETQKQYQLQKIQALVDKLPSEFIVLKFDEILKQTDTSKKSMIIQALAEKMKKKAKRDDKIKFFTRLVELDQSYAHYLAGLQRI